MSDKMVRMVPTMGVVVVRDGERVKPAINKAFPFTQAEIDTILLAAPNGLRKPSNEDDGSDEAAPASSTTGKAGVGPSAEASQAKAQGGKKKATSNKSDQENADDAKGGDDDL